MPTVQSTFNNDFAVGYPGMVANGETSNRISRTIADAAGIGFGVAAFRHASEPHSITGDVQAGAKLLGVTIVDHGVPIFPGGSADTYAQYQNVPILERGVIWVYNRSGGALAPGDALDIDVNGEFVGEGDGIINAEGWQVDLGGADDALIRITNNRPFTGSMT